MRLGVEDLWAFETDLPSILWHLLVKLTTFCRFVPGIPLGNLVSGL